MFVHLFKVKALQTFVDVGVAGVWIKGTFSHFFLLLLIMENTCYTSYLVVYLVNSSYKTLFCNNSRNYPKITLAMSQTRVKKKDAEIKT